MSQYDALAQMSEMTAEAPLRKFYEEPTFFAALGDVTGRSVLDLACGTGIYTRRLKQRGATRVVGIDESEGMIAYARERESRERAGIEFQVRDARHLGELGVFDVVTATYLLHYAPTRDALFSMAKSIRASVAKGGLFASICFNPDARLSDPEYYRAYGFAIECSGREGDESALHILIPGMETTLKAFYWTRATYEAALVEAGFSDVKWATPLVSDEGLQAFPPGFWDAYVAAPHAAVFTARG